MRLTLTHRLLAAIIAALVPVTAIQAWSALELERWQVEETHAEALRILQLISVIPGR